MIKLVLLRHGESTWNNENRFTGWTDVDLTARGQEEAKAAGKILHQNGFTNTNCYAEFKKVENRSTQVIQHCCRCHLEVFKSHCNSTIYVPISMKIVE